MLELIHKFELDPDIAGAEREVSLEGGEAYLRQAFEIAKQIETNGKNGLPSYTSSHEMSPVERRVRECLAVAASSFRRAAAHSIVLDDWKAAPQQFAAAGRAYDSAGLPYASLMHRLGQEHESEVQEFDRQVRHQQFDRLEDFDLILKTKTWLKQQMVYPMLVDAAFGTDSKHRRVFVLFQHELEGQRWSRVGVLGMPISVLLDLVAALTSGEALEIDALRPLLRIYDVSIRRAMSDHHHWRRFGTPFHPIEPDVFSILIALREYYRLNNSSLSSAVAEVRMHPFCREAILDVLKHYPEQAAGPASPLPVAFN
jgi:hypothetical protein